MLFLGAGASKEIGPPTMKKLSQVLEKEFQKEGYINLILDIKNRLNNFGLKEDEIEFETFFSILNGLENPTRSIKELGPFAMYMSNLVKKSLPKVPEKFREITEKVIVQECLKFNEDKAINIYRPLLKVLSFKSARKVVLADGREFQEQLCRPIVTTNYDLVLEKTIPKLYGDNSRFNRGFEFLRNYRGSFFSNDLYRTGYVDYVKLHGSIDWFWRADINKIEELRWEPKELSYYDEAYRGRTWIFPIQEKYVSKYPNSILHGYFQKMLLELKIYIVIGYSFRDPAINNAFIDALNENKDSRIVIINPRPEKFLNLIKFPKVSIIQRGIEDPELPKELDEILNEKPRA